MAIMRTKKQEKPFVQIDKGIFNDETISFKAKGIIGYLLSKPDDWITYVADLEKRSTDGRDSVRSGIRELIDAGYMEKSVARYEDGTFKGYEYTVREYRHNNIPTEYGKSEIGLSEIGKSDVGKSNTTNKEVTNNDLTNKEGTNIPYVEIVNYLNSIAGTKYRSSTKKTRSLIKARFDEGFTLEDFQKVIDIKTREWKHDQKFSKYLRPDTLFSPKFEGYLNQEVNEPDTSQFEGLF